MSGELAFEIHALTARLDRAADRLLSAEMGISYRRFLVLFMVDRLGASTQRALAEALDVSEPSVSRMTGLLESAGLLDVSPAPSGNRRSLSLTPQGRGLAQKCEKLLSDRLATVVENSGIPAAAFVRHTRRLSAALDDAGRTAGSSR